MKELGKLADKLGLLKAKQAELAKEVKECQLALRPHLKNGACVAGHRFQVTLSEGVSLRFSSKAAQKLLNENQIAMCKENTSFTRFNVNALSAETAGVLPSG